MLLLCELPWATEKWYTTISVNRQIANLYAWPWPLDQRRSGAQDSEFPWQACFLNAEHAQPWLSSHWNQCTPLPGGSQYGPDLLMFALRANVYFSSLEAVQRGQKRWEMGSKQELGRFPPWLFLNATNRLSWTKFRKENEGLPAFPFNTFFSYFPMSFYGLVLGRGKK